MSRTYSNPIQRNGDFADPFVLRHDGRYYLYCTNPDVRCWSSADLVEWTLEGPTIEPDAFPGLVPFAPEVVYADGYFYMYTSPSGHGHYVLKSESPTGPFRVISGNVGHAIDGNVFIDDDGKWYFYWAGDEGIWGCEMKSPTQFGEPVFTGIHMNGWTEGPFVSTRDGLYFMTLTGNHYLSPGYRIDAASSLHPLRGYRADPLNPVLISTSGNVLGLGHSSSIWGPDLVSTYLVYHNLNPDASRDLDLDRQVSTGHRLQVLGPTTSAPVPPRADAEWAGDAATPPLPKVFTAEVNLTAASSGDYGLSLGDSLVLRVDPAADLLTAVGAADELLVSSVLPHGFAHTALHCWRLTYENGDLQLFIDGRLQLSLHSELPVASRIGYLGDPQVGRCAITHETPDGADRRAVKPVPGRFWSELGEGDLFPLAMEYRVHVQQPGRSTAFLAGQFAMGDVLAFAIDGARRGEVHVDKDARLVSFPLELHGTEEALTLHAMAGSPAIRLITIAPEADGDSAAFSDEALSGVGKRILGDKRWADAVITATVSLGLESSASHADLILRAAQLSEGGEGDDTRLGLNFFLGYSVQLHRDCVVLARHDYDERVLARVDLPVDTDRRYQLEVHAVGGLLRVLVDGVELIRFDDALAHPLGQVGIRAVDARLQVESLTIMKAASIPGAGG